jgi:hypothetical protein
MGQLIDCSDEFKMRMRYNKIQRVIAEQNMQHRVIVVIQEDATSDTGIGYMLYDKYTKDYRPLDNSMFVNAGL